MATYNTTLQSYNIKLQTLLTGFNNLPDAVALNLQNKTFTENGIYTADSGYDALGTVTVNVEGGDVDHSAEDGIITGELTSYTNSRVTAIDMDVFTSWPSLTSVNFPKVTSIGSNAFMSCSSLTSVNFPEAITIGRGAFYSCISLTSVNFPKTTTIDESVFYRCSSLTSVNFPLATVIGNCAFQFCSNLTSVSFSACSTIGSSAFEFCSSLTSATFPLCTTIGSDAFFSCSNLTSVNIPKCTYVGSRAFRYCSKLTTISFPMCSHTTGRVFQDCSGLSSVFLPACTVLGGATFANCTSLPVVNFPMCTMIGSTVFSNCYNLTSVSLPMCSIIGSSAFYGCSNLTLLSLPAITNIYPDVFNRCYNLKSLYLMGATVCTLSNSNAFTSTPIGGYSTSAGTYGSIYVPASLLTTYQSATNWAYFSSRFVGAGLITFTIEGVSYKAGANMTWKEWCDSVYNVNNYTYNTIVQSSKGNRLYNGSSLVFASDTIVEGAVYTYSSSDGQQLYFIAHDLSGSILSNTQTSIGSGESYTTTFTTINGYSADVIVTMGGTDITNTAFDGDATITITSITGDIVIIVAERLVNFLPISTDTDRMTTYNNIGYYNGMRWSKSGGKIVTGNTTTSMTGFIPCKPGDVLRIYNYTRQSGVAWYIITFDDNQNVIQCREHGGASPNGAYESPGYAETTLSTSNYGAGFTSIRLSWGQFNDDSIVTINQEIPAWSNQ